MGFSSFAKGLFVGIVVGAAVVLMYVPRRRTFFRRYVPLDSARFQRRYQALPETTVEENSETGNRAKRNIGLLLVFLLISAVAKISGLRVNRS
jgi:gas vesicle protein